MLARKIIATRISEQIAKEKLLKKFSNFGVSEVKIEKTPLGMKVILRTSKPGFLVTRASQLIKEASKELGEYFKQEPPHIDVEATDDPMLNPEVIADSIAFKISKYGPMRYKTIAHGALEDIMRAGARGAEIEIGGVIKERAAHFKFKPPGSVLPKSGQPEQYGVRTTKKQLLLKRGMIGIKVTIVVKAQMPGEVQMDGRKSEGPGNGTPENEHKENTGVTAS